MKNKALKKRKRRAVLRIASGCVLGIAAAALIAASVFFRFDKWRALDPELIVSCPQSLRICSNTGELVSLKGPEKRIWVRLGDLQKHTPEAFIAAEDARFYTHEGVDLYRIFGAAWADIKAGGFVQGASTISQQLIKLSHLSPEKTMDRKLEEAVLALQLERNFTKDEILEMYLNYIYFGGGFYGVETAALGYFGVHASELTAAQSAQLAGILKSPSAYAPHIDPEASKRRRDLILGLMLQQGFLDENEYEAALAEEPELRSAIPDNDNELIELAITEAAELTSLTRGELLAGGYSIYTTLDTELEENCRELINDPSLVPSDNAQAALVVIGAGGHIEAMIGGRGEYAATGINRAADAERQPGSLIKPILVYAPAVELYGYTPATVLKDEQTSFGDYSPRNSDEKYYGEVTLREAVTRSLNIPAVKVLSDIGVPSAVDYARRMGISFESETLGLPLALGGFTHGVSPLEMAGAYSVFANGGVYIKPTCVTRITDSKGRVLYSESVSGERIMSRENAFILTSMLRSVAEEGTGRRLASTGLPLAAKTGTSVDGSGVRDAWCAAYTCEHTAVVWMGTDTAAEGSLPESAVGGNQPAILLGRLFLGIYASRTCPEPEKPEGVTEYSIDVSDMDSGNIYAAQETTPKEFVRREYFTEGSEPTERDPRWMAPLPPSEVGWSIGENGKPVISFMADETEFGYKIIRSDPSGNERTVCEFSEAWGYTSFTDESAAPGGAYVYTVIAENPRLRDANGAPIQSEPSRKLRIVVPFFG